MNKTTIIPDTILDLNTLSGKQLARVDVSAVPYVSAVVGGTVVYPVKQATIERMARTETKHKSRRFFSTASFKFDDTQNNKTAALHQMNVNFLFSWFQRMSFPLTFKDAEKFYQNTARKQPDIFSLPFTRDNNIFKVTWDGRTGIVSVKNETSPWWCDTQFVVAAFRTPETLTRFKNLLPTAAHYSIDRIDYLLKRISDYSFRDEITASSINYAVVCQVIEDLLVLEENATHLVKLDRPIDENIVADTLYILESLLKAVLYQVDKAYQAAYIKQIGWYSKAMEKMFYEEKNKYIREFKQGVKDNTRDIVAELWKETV